MNPQHLIPQILLRSWPFPRGAGYIVNHFFYRLAFDAEVASVRTTDGFSISVLPNELVGRHIYLTGECDRSTVEVLLKFSKPGDVLLDIGANIGYVSACFLQKVPHSKAIAVEPQPQIVDLLRSNLEPFGDERYKVFPVAISDIDCSGWIEICDLNRGASKIVDERNPGYGTWPSTPSGTSITSHTVEIQLWSAKRLFASLQGEKIDLVKIDVEGHEEIVLRDCQAELSQLLPRAIVFEDCTQSSAPDGSIGRIFRSIGYEVLGVKKKLTRLDFHLISSARDCVYRDYLAVPVGERR
jgi:FkbM family methyltransferase